MGVFITQEEKSKVCPPEHPRNAQVMRIAVPVFHVGMRSPVVLLPGPGVPLKKPVRVGAMRSSGARIDFAKAITATASVLSLTPEVPEIALF